MARDRIHTPEDIRLIKGLIARELAGDWRYLKRSLNDAVIDAILLDMDACPTGRSCGDQYRNKVSRFLGEVLQPIVVSNRVRHEARHQRRKVDIELPIRLECVDYHPLWREWTTRYRVRSILAEVKNSRTLRDGGTLDAVGQVLDAMGAKSGYLGLLVSRSGFTRDALDKLAEVAEGGQRLVLPLDDSALKLMAAAAHGGTVKVMEFLREIETGLLQRL